MRAPSSEFRGHMAGMSVNGASKYSMMPSYDLDVGDAGWSSDEEAALLRPPAAKPAPRASRPLARLLTSYARVFFLVLLWYAFSISLVMYNKVRAAP